MFWLNLMGGKDIANRGDKKELVHHLDINNDFLFFLKHHRHIAYGFLYSAAFSKRQS